MDDDLRRSYRRLGVAKIRNPRDRQLLLDAMGWVIDPTGAINPKAAEPFRTPFVLRWAPGDTAPWPMARAGVPVLVRAYAATAPTTGNAIVSLTQETLAGSDPLATLTILQGSKFGEAPLTGITIDAGAWVFAAVTTANGASGVSIALIINTGD